MTGVKTFNPEKSTIFWKGHKLFGYHSGKIDLKSGEITFENGQINGGHFVVDMSSIVVTDLLYDGEEEEEEEEEESPKDDKNDLANHLMDPDFFDAASFPSASYTITSSHSDGNNYSITGDMTKKMLPKNSL